MVSRAQLQCFALAAAFASLSGCGTDRDGSSDVARDLSGTQSAATQRGELLALACQPCHALTPAGGPDIGPSLYGVFGRPAASLADFEYSEALRGAQFVWTAERLDAWLQAPVEYLPGTTMVFAGYGDPQDRAALIAWLQVATEPVSE